MEAALPRTAILRTAGDADHEGARPASSCTGEERPVAIAVGNSVVEVVGPGGTFGEMAVIDQSPRTARAGTLEETELLAIDREALIDVVRKHPEIAMALLRAIADRLRHMNKLIAQ